MPQHSPTKLPAEIMEEMAATFQKRDAAYGANWLKHGDVMAAFFPCGVSISGPIDLREFHLFSMIVAKLGRFANSSFRHTDSIHDVAVYAAMLESSTTTTLDDKES